MGLALGEEHIRVAAAEHPACHAAQRDHVGQAECLHLWLQARNPVSSHASETCAVPHDLGFQLCLWKMAQNACHHAVRHRQGPLLNL